MSSDTVSPHPDTGTVAVLPVLRRVRAGLLLDGGTLGEVLLPARELGEDPTAASLRVFLYEDGDGQPRASARLPRLLPGQVGRLRVVSVSRVGAFLDWGLPKDLLLPFAEQGNRPEVGRWQTVRVVRDRSGRLFASARLDRWLEDTCDQFAQGDAVSLVVVQRTELGYKVAVEDRYWGLLAEDGAADLKPGQRLTGYVQRLREDRRLSLSPNPPGAAKREGVAERVLQRLRREDGFLPLGDKSAPEDIRAAFGCSKNAFKQAIGKLYKDGEIVIEPAGIRLR
ncbi:S1 RNA-binding domain-containing protein [Alloalcanivorax gelatiniphagus]|uniref:CvfB family protein n=1 Tax=Alloalcanivorax gelatiniphagus TaxID=1194167 RepID=UPI001F0FDAC2|nr:S1-like domain-containing RNA-binding protein [Alloalcanivorax gelatiniphagus]